MGYFSVILMHGIGRYMTILLGKMMCRLPQMRPGTSKNGQHTSMIANRTKILEVTSEFAGFNVSSWSIHGVYVGTQGPKTGPLECLYLLFCLGNTAVFSSIGRSYMSSRSFWSCPPFTTSCGVVWSYERCWQRMPFGNTSTSSSSLCRSSPQAIHALPEHPCMECLYDIWYMCFTFIGRYGYVLISQIPRWLVNEWRDNLHWTTNV